MRGDGSVFTPAETRRAYTQEYSQGNSAELKERAKKHHQASWEQVPSEELERLRLPENRLESLQYGPEEKTVCLECGRIGDNLSRHTWGCLVKRQPSNDYKERWGFDRSNPLTSPKQRQAYSQSQRRSPTFDRRREAARKQLPAARAARTGAKRGPMRLESKMKRRGKRTGARPHLQKIPDSKVLEIFVLDLSLAEKAKRLGISQTAAYRRAQRLFLDTSGVQSQLHACVQLVFKMRPWLASPQSQIPTIGQITQHYMDLVRSGMLTASRELSSFLTHMEAELRQRPEWIAEIAVERAKKALAPKTLELAIRIFQRMRTASAASAPAPASSTIKPKGEKKRGHPPGPRKRTVLLNEMAAISEIQACRQKEVAGDFFPNTSSAIHQQSQTYDYFSHHRAEIASAKVPLQGLSSNELTAIYDRDRQDLLSLLSKKKPLRRSTRRKIV